MSATLTNIASDIAINTPSNISYIHLNSDGTYEDSNIVKASLFIDANQISKLRDTEITAYIRKAFGPFIGIMHSNPTNTVKVPKSESIMFVLGG